MDIILIIGVMIMIIIGLAGTLYIQYESTKLELELMEGIRDILNDVIEILRNKKESAGNT